MATTEEPLSHLQATLEEKIRKWEPVGPSRFVAEEVHKVSLSIEHARNIGFEHYRNNTWNTVYLLYPNSISDEYFKRFIEKYSHVPQTTVFTVPIIGMSRDEIASVCTILPGFLATHDVAFVLGQFRLDSYEETIHCAFTPIECVTSTQKIDFKRDMIIGYLAKFSARVGHRFPRFLH